MKNWKINSWRKYPVKHIPEYPDKKELDQVLDKIKTFPPLVFAGETRHLKQQLAEVVDGKAFLLQGGDCHATCHEHIHAACTYITRLPPTPPNPDTGKR